MSPTLHPRQLLTFCKQNRWFLIVPTAVFTLAALVYAVTKPETWQATQSLLVRDEAGGGLSGQGRFESTEAMKTAQETILEISKSPSVVKAALSAVGPDPARRQRANWPLDDDVESLRQAITIKAPNGAEFGQTELIHLVVKAPTSNRAAKLASAVSGELDHRLRELRDVKGRSISAELEKAVALAQADLDTATNKLEKLESAVGTDLGELRSLSDAAGGDSDLRSALNQIRTELRTATATHETNSQTKEHLRDAQDDPDRLIAMPRRLLETQPALQRLKDGLVDAQLNTARLKGRMSKNHPHVQAAVVAEGEVRADLRSELGLALQALTGDLMVSGRRVKALQQQETDIKSRLDRLATLRARYSNLVEDVAQRTDVLSRAYNDLANARASQGGAESASLISRLDGPVAGSHPLGPGKSTVVLLGLLGGLVTGLGLVFLKGPLEQLRGRRWSDFLPARRASDQDASGRRTADRSGGRRLRDPASEPAMQRREKDQPQSRPPQAPSEAERRSEEDRRGGDRRQQSPKLESPAE